MSTGKRAYDLLRGYVHREWERIQGVAESDAERELEESLRAPAPERSAPAEPRTPVERNARARKLLGVGPEASFGEIRKQFERLDKRCDPENFPAGSAERREAAELQRLARWAYQVLGEDVDATEKRFRSLEIEP
ncbi:MAG: J domain-containing protein [Chthonomonadaceae bacterium]|nr:J domain-containing protein [Chthonomonadaceae bacterium]